MDNSNVNDNAQWGIVELMGHKVVAGRVSKSEMLGKPLLRVDVPQTSAFPEFTQFYGETAIYCITFVSEQVALLAAEQAKVNPVSVYAPDLVTRKHFDETVREYQERLQRLRALPGPSGEEEDEGVGHEASDLFDDDDDDEGEQQ